MSVLWISIALAAEPVVSVSGVGAVPLSAAVETCNSEVANSAMLSAPSAQRSVAFHTVVVNQYGLPPEQRSSYFRGEAGNPWPATEVQAQFVPRVPLVQPGVVASCEAVGRYWLARGTQLQAVCPADRGACRDRFGDAAADTLKDAFKASKKASDPTDTFFALLRQANLADWSDPVPFLAKACRAPATYGERGRFLDTESLGSARRACLQLITLAKGQAPTTLELGCDTPWADATLEAGRLEVPPGSLGLANDAVNVESLALDQLSRMDPSPAACSGSWASAWRKNLHPLWMEAQEAQACEEAVLPLEQRFELCPALPARVTQACAGGDAVECLTLAEMAQRGVGMSKDLMRAADMVRTACDMGHEPACEALSAEQPIVDGWLALRHDALNQWRSIREQLRTGHTPDLPPPPLGAEARPNTPEARVQVDSVDAADQTLSDCADVVTVWSDAWGPEWVQTQAKVLFDIAVEAELVESGRLVLQRFGADLDPQWLADAEASLDLLTPAP